MTSVSNSSKLEIFNLLYIYFPVSGTSLTDIDFKQSLIDSFKSLLFIASKALINSINCMAFLLTP